MPGKYQPDGERVHLKAIEHNKTMSRETHAFSASVYFDGSKVGVISNSGGGEPDMFDETNPEKAKEMFAYIKGLPPVKAEFGGGKSMDLDVDLDMICCDIVNKHIRMQQMKARMRTHVLFTKDHESTEVFEVPMKGKKYPLEAMRDAIVKKNPGCVILNSLSDAAGLKIWEADLAPA